MPSKIRYYELKAKGICTECACKPVFSSTRCERCYAKNLNRKRLYKRKLYDFTFEDLKALQEECKGLCQICGRPAKLMLDHCHTTNKVRGLLCHFCNAGLGFFQDNTQSLKNAVTYLERFWAEG